MQSKKQVKALSALAIAAVSGLGAQYAHAATLDSYYINAVITTTPTPTKQVFTGTGTNSTVVSITGASPTITVPVGDYITYGVAQVVTNNVNPNGGSTFGDGAGNTNGITDPTNLGLADSGYQVINVSANNLNGQLLQPVLNGIRGTAGTLVQFNSTAVNGGLGKAGKAKSGYSFALHDVGDAEQNNGLVGAGFQIFQGNATYDPTSATGIASLTYFAGTTPSLAAASTAFDSLGYQALAAGTVTLQASADPTATQYWRETTPGGSTTPASYIATYFSSTDAIHALPVLTVNILGGPSSHAIINLSAAANSTYAPVLGHLTVTGSNGSYNVAQVTGLSNTIGSVEGNGFTPPTDTEIYALDVLVNGSQATASQLATILTEISATGLQAGLSVSSTMANDPFASNYNLFVTAAGLITGAGDNFLGFDLTTSNDANLPGGITVSAVALVPEPMSLGVLALGAVGLLGRRRRA
jgi:hypothetical protein